MKTAFIAAALLAVSLVSFNVHAASKATSIDISDVVLDEGDVSTGDELIESDDIAVPVTVKETLATTKASTSMGNTKVSRQTRK